MSQYSRKPDMERQRAERGPHGGVTVRVPGSNRDKVLSLVEAEPEIGVAALVFRTGLPRFKVVQILAAEGYLRSEDDRYPVGDPKRITELLKALQRAHPTGGVRVNEKRAPRWTPPANLAPRSYVGCSAATAAEHGDDLREKQEARS